MQSTIDLFFLLLRYALWGGSLKSSSTHMSHEQYQNLMDLGEKQTVMGLIAQTLIENDAILEQDDVFDAFGLTQSIEQQNRLLDKATAKMCRMMAAQNIRIIVVKGQTLAPLYRYPTQRQCGDVDFVCHPDDLGKAVRYLRDELGLTLHDEGSNKHASFNMNGVKYEIHRTLTNFASPKHQQYWENVVMKEVWENPRTMTIDGTAIPVLPSTFNALYVFVHIMFHLIVDGIGIRQFCDWAVVMDNEGGRVNNKLLRQHLDGIGMLRAYSGLCAVLTDYLGLPKEKIPVEISDSKHQHAISLINNILKMGNFGHNIAYKSARGPKHAIEHAIRMGRQGLLFYHYAPKEVLWRIPYFIGWWGQRVFRAMTPFRKSSITVFQR